MYIYGIQVAPLDDGAANTTELEAVDVVIALHAVLLKGNQGSLVRARCCNQAVMDITDISFFLFFKSYS